ncbi:hypothetical protein T439DRAFT_324472 [Meredithblackwellia eburnea MCA 4105]
MRQQSLVGLAILFAWLPHLVLALTVPDRTFLQERAPAPDPIILYKDEVFDIEKRATTTATVGGTPFNVAHPGATPALVKPLVPVLLPVATAARVILAVVAPPASPLAAAATNLVAGLLQALPNVLCAVISCPQSSGTQTASSILSSISPTCLNSSYTETMINTLFQYGGANTTVYLCPSTVISLQNPIIFTAANQTLATRGFPTDSTRATIRVTGAAQSNAIYAACDLCSYIKIRNIQVDGNRPNLGYMASPPGVALIEMGGNTIGQMVDNSHIFEPRGWSALHVIEGLANDCSSSVITNNQIGPAGHAPSGATQYKRAMSRRDTGTYSPGQWADGISMACQKSTVTGNTITDATDGAIVLFGAPGTIVKNNVIISDQRQLLGAINAVDFWPYAGSFTGVQVTGNTIQAKNSMIKVGLAIGTLTWGTLNMTAYHNYDGSWTGNTFTSGPTGYFGFGATVGGHNNAVVTGNTFNSVSFGGVANSPPCTITLPPFGPLIKDPYTCTGGTFQNSFVNHAVAFMICSGPGAISKSGVSLTN